MKTRWDTTFLQALAFSSYIYCPTGEEKSRYFPPINLIWVCSWAQRQFIAHLSLHLRLTRQWIRQLQRGALWRAGWCCEGNESSLCCRVEPNPAVPHHEDTSVARMCFCGTNLPSALLALPRKQSCIPPYSSRKCRSGNLAQCTFEMEEHGGRSGLSTRNQDEWFSSVLGYIYFLIVSLQFSRIEWYICKMIDQVI